MNRIIALVVAIVIVALVASSTVLVVDPRHTAVLSSRDGGTPALAGPVCISSCRSRCKPRRSSMSACRRSTPPIR